MVILRLLFGCSKRNAIEVILDFTAGIAATTFATAMMQGGFA